MGRPRKHNKRLPQRVYIRRGKYYYVDKSGSWLQLADNEPDALKALSEILSDYAPMGDVFDRYERECLPLKAPATQKTNQAELVLLRAAFAKMEPRAIKARHIYAYMAKRSAKIRANREIALLSAVLTKAVQWGLIDHNHCREVRRAPERPRDRYVSPPEFGAVWVMASPTMKAAMSLAYFAGMRQKDIRELQWDQIKGKWIHTRQSKTGKRLKIRITPAIAKALRLAKSDSSYVISTRKGDMYTKDGFGANWKRLIAKYDGERYTFHDLRGAAGSETKDDRLLGHLDPKMLRKAYNRKPWEVEPWR